MYIITCGEVNFLDSKMYRYEKPLLDLKLSSEIFGSLRLLQVGIIVNYKFIIMCIFMFVHELYYVHVYTHVRHYSLLLHFYLPHCSLTHFKEFKLPLE